MSYKAPITVIIPTYNSEGTIAKAIESVLSTAPSVEQILIIDDYSSDRTMEIAQDFESTCKQLQWIPSRAKINRGVSWARNQGIRHANNKFIAFLDADDTYSPNRFTNHIQYLEQNSEALAVVGPVAKIDSNSQDSEKILGPTENSTQNNLFEQLLNNGNECHIHTNGITVRKSAFAKVGLFNENLALSQDSEMWIKLSSTNSVVPLPEKKAIANYYRHDSNRSGKRLDEQYKYWCLMMKNLLTWSKEIPLSKNRIKLLSEKFEAFWYPRFQFIGETKTLKFTKLFQELSVNPLEFHGEKVSTFLGQLAWSIRNPNEC